MPSAVISARLAEIRRNRSPLTPTGTVGLANFALLFPYMTIKVIPLATHPSKVADAAG